MTFICDRNPSRPGCAVSAAKQIGKCFIASQGANFYLITPRRPIDPPPIIQLVVRPTSNKANTSPEGSLGFLQNPYYFMFASLAKPDDDTELHWLKVKSISFE